jgi:hypothetical protein
VKKLYHKSVLEGLNRIPKSNEILKEEDLEVLPDVVAKYVRFTGAVGRPRVNHFFVKTNGKIRGNPNDPWMSLITEQYNFMDLYERFFYIKAIKSGVPAYGLHSFKNGEASMKIKLLGLFTIVNAKGPEMYQSETITILNDMCLLAPGTLIDPKIKWERVDNLSVIARFNGPVNVSALLTFHEDGRLLDFRSEDRYDSSGGKNFILRPWSTPISEYGEFNGLILPKTAEAIYERPEGKFTYITLTLDKIIHNPVL